MINITSLSSVAMIAAGAISGLNVLKDVLTVDGDLKAKYPTLAIKRGVRVAAIAGALFTPLGRDIAFSLSFGGRCIADLFAIALWAGIRSLQPHPRSEHQILQMCESGRGRSTRLLPYPVAAVGVVSRALLIAAW